MSEFQMGSVLQGVVCKIERLGVFRMWTAARLHTAACIRDTRYSYRTSTRTSSAHAWVPPASLPPVPSLQWSEPVVSLFPRLVILAYRVSSRQVARYGHAGIQQACCGAPHWRCRASMQGACAPGGATSDGNSPAISGIQQVAAARIPAIAT